MNAAEDHALEFLLAFNGRTHWYEGGYFLKFEIRRVTRTRRRPHGLRYSFTLHAPEGGRLLGFDNAHGVSRAGSQSGRRSPAVDHWHRTVDDPGRPYEFTDVETLIADFFDEAARILRVQGVPFEAKAVGDTRRRR